MTKKIDENDRVRKAYAARGERGQKMVNFRCDLDNIEKLSRQLNKGRFINDAIRAYGK
jgi:hypothetical protein